LTEPRVAVHATGPAIAVTALLSQAGSADPDGGKLLQGLAIIGAAAAGGTWHALPSVSSSSALLLPSTAYVRLVAGSQPGTATLTLAGWDQTLGTADQLFDITSTGGASAFSTASTKVSIAI